MLRAWIVTLLLVLANYANAQNVSGLPISKLPQATLPLSGNEVFPLSQNGVTKQTLVNNASTSVPFLASGIGATFSATSPTRAGRGADAKLDFGAICDGRSHTLSGSYSSLAAAQIDYPQALDLAEEKDTAAISQLISVFRASTGAFGPVARLNAVNLGACVINRTLPLYSIRTAGARLYWSGTKLICYGNSPGLICVDGAMNEFATWYDFTLNGQAANFISGSVPPKVGLFVGRDSVAGRANNNNYIGLDIENHFTLSSLDNFSAEVNGFGYITLSNTEPNAYALIQDGCNHFGVASPTLGNSAPVDSPVSFYGNTFTSGSAVVTGSGSYPVFLCYTYNHHFNNIYTTSTGGPALSQSNVRIWSSIPGIFGDESIGLTWDQHTEGGPVSNGMASVFAFAGPNTARVITKLFYRDAGFGAAVNIFKAEAGITSVTMPGLQFSVGNIHNGQAVFDQPPIYQTSGDYDLGNAPLQSMWNLPAANWKGCLTAVNTVKCQLDGNFQPYGMNVSLGAGGELDVASAGSLTGLAFTSTAGYGANTSGAYAFPALTISAPDVTGGIQATAHVSGWGFFAAPAVGGGSNWVPGGSGYSVNDVLTLPGGTCSSQPQIKALTVDGIGSVLTWQKQTVGVCTIAMAMPVTLTGGTGTGATLSRAAWTPLTGVIDNAGVNTGYLNPTATIGDVVYNNNPPPGIAFTITPATVAFGTLRVVPSTFAAAGTCVAATEGKFAAISDSTTNTWGATVTGGGALHIKEYCDGTNWTVEAK